MKIIYALLVAIWPALLTAQSSLRIEASYEFSRLTSQFNYKGYSPSSSIYGSLAYEMKILNWLAVSPGIAILERGQDREAQTREKVRLTYASLQSPFLIYPFPEERLQFFFLLGPYLNIKTNARLYNVGFSFSEEPQDLSSGFNERTKPTDHGMLLGTGLSYRFKKLSVFASAKYHMGFTPISDINPFIAAPNGDFVDVVFAHNRKIRAYGVGLGVSYALGSRAG